MKTRILLIALIFVGLSKGQEHKKIYVETQYGKASHLVFPSDIADFDLGEPTGFEVNKKENILKIYPLTKKPLTTNILVKTTELDYYSFTIQNVASSNKTDYFLRKDDATHSGKQNYVRDLRHYAIDKQAIRDNKIEVDIKTLGCSETSKKPDYLLNRGFLGSRTYKAENQKVEIILTGIYVNESNMYFKFRLLNESFINFDISSVTFTVSKKKKKRKTTIQPRQLPIVTQCKELDQIPHSSYKDQIIVLKKFTLADDEVLYIDVFEKPEANRHLNLKIPAKIVAGANTLF